ncbi:MAG: hypothetical protein EZS28_023708, partial [Streblomastix strix]
MHTHSQENAADSFKLQSRVVILAGRRDILTEMCDMPDIEDKS